MDGESYDLLAGIVGTGLLGAAGDLDPWAVGSLLVA